MFGKASLFLVMGFSLIFLIFGQNFGRIGNQAVDNYVNYYGLTVAHNIAQSGANIVVNHLYRDNSYRSGIDDSDFLGGKLLVDILDIDITKKILEVKSVGIFNGDTSEVQVKLQPGNFSQYAYLSEQEKDPNGSPIWWTTGDTVNGPFHTQDYLRVLGHPVFNGDVSTKMGMIQYGSQNNNNGNSGGRRGRRGGRGGGGGGGGGSSQNTSDLPIINGKYTEGTDIPIPSTSASDFSGIAANDGHTFSSHDTVYITFAADSIKYRYSYRSAPTTVLASSFAPNGVIYTYGAVVRVQGVVKGQYTVVSDYGSSYGEKGSIYIDNDLTYYDDPRSDHNSTDMLGLVAKKNVYITDNTPNRNNVVIQASIFAQTGGFGAENYDSGRARGYIMLYGGITQHVRLPVGTTGGRNGSTGYLKSYNYDYRFQFSFPPYFPGTGSFRIVSWYEWNYLSSP